MYIPNKVLSRQINPLTVVQNINQQIFLDGETTFISVTNENQTIKVSLSSCKQSTILFETEKSLPDYDLAISYIFHFLFYSKDNRRQRIQKNITLISEIEKKLIENESISQDNGFLNVENQEKRELHAVRDFLKKYLSHRQIFILPFQNKVSEKKFLWALANTAYSKFPLEKKTVKFNKNEILYLEITGPNSGFQFLNTSNLMIDINSHKYMLEDFLSLSKLSKKHFNIDMHTMQIETITQMASLYYFNNCTYYNSISFISPTKDLFHRLYNYEVRFGFIHAQKTLISEQSEFKTYLNLDFSKFYTSCLKNVKFFYNVPIEFQNNKGKFEKTKTTLKHETLSNLLFSTLESICEGYFRFGLYAKEARLSSFPQDCIISKDGQFNDITVLTFFGLVVITNMSLDFNYLLSPFPNPPTPTTS